MKKVVLTGGSAGIGKEINLFLLRNGYEVLFTFRKSSQSANEIISEFPLAKSYQIDFSNPDEIDDFLKEIQDFKPNILINNFYCGTFIDSYFHKTDPDKFLADFQTNIIPTLQTTQECIKIFRKEKFGRIINILSSSLKNPAMGTSVYNANKAYLLQMSKSWASENVKFGITSNSVSPAFTMTDFHKDMDERQVENILASYPLKNNLEGKDIAEFVELCLNGGSHFNGNHLFLDASNS
ncbi:SDR family NAD(P)-dependent oxidoreductase [Kaistella antarctica]|uniref:3-oxoacyl-[acyl-carrier-protein] reductase FabG n=1 Tax=Kaistella antarctica TaxID=266748 RepID=A0A448NSC8_9FLAO|nr:SDR family oxidoreductase [Kaistella antarctica]KEY17786.1 hypothetical protein HY04_04405 [Kaistella antarctica]SEV79950.1 acetoacetyl-CoA reductase/3-oxoacyl-[acyl-carrier protein] reductase [Kaistella antarctica]VEH99978.1 3-oxoacyl-[acyl-carrier-protein] reductase FabG [Kaistella antarctica]